MLEWDRENFSIKSLTSYQVDDILVRRDNDRNDLDYLPPFALLPSEYDPETNKQTTTPKKLTLSHQNQCLVSSWVAGFFYLNTEIEISILERLDFGFDGVFDPFTIDDVYSYSGDFGFITTQTRERLNFILWTRNMESQDHLELYLG